MKRRVFIYFSSICLGFMGFGMVAGAQKIADRPTAELLRFGRTLYQRGDCFSSRYLYQTVLEREPGNVTALSGKGQALICEGSVEEGVTTLEQAAQMAPEQGQTYVQLASAYLEQFESDPENHAARLGQALTALEQAQAAGADGGAVLNLRGVVLYRQGKLPEARDVLAEATQLVADKADYHLDLGRVELELGQTEEAVATLRRAVSLEPDSALGHNQLGTAYLLLGRCDDAVFELEQAVTLAPDAAEVNFNVARASFDCNKMTEARSYFEKVVALEPTAFPPAYTYLARIDLAASDFDAAVTQATKGALLPPTNAEAYYWLGQTYEARGAQSEGAADTDKAASAYERALELDAAFAPAREALGTLDTP